MRKPLCVSSLNIMVTASSFTTLTSAKAIFFFYCAWATAIVLENIIILLIIKKENTHCFINLLLNSSTTHKVSSWIWFSIVFSPMPMFCKTVRGNVEFHIFPLSKTSPTGTKETEEHRRIGSTFMKSKWEYSCLEITRILKWDVKECSSVSLGTKASPSWRDEFYFQAVLYSSCRITLLLCLLSWQALEISELQAQSSA